MKSGREEEAGNRGRASWVWRCSLSSALSFSSSPRKDAVAAQKRLRNCPECNYGSKETGGERLCNSLPILRNSVPNEDESTGRVIKRHRRKFHHCHFSSSSWPVMDLCKLWFLHHKPVITTLRPPEPILRIK